MPLSDLLGTGAPFMGIDVVVSKHLGEFKRVQVRFPRTKRKRIRKKWAKNHRNWVSVPAKPVFYKMKNPVTGRDQIVTNTLGLAAIQEMFNGEALAGLRDLEPLKADFEFGDKWPSALTPLEKPSGTGWLSSLPLGAGIWKF